jgi:hypothetical protein
MLKIKVNGAITSLMACSRPDRGWDLRCMDPLLSASAASAPARFCTYGRRNPENGSSHPRWT